MFTVINQLLKCYCDEPIIKMFTDITNNSNFHCCKPITISFKRQ